MVVVLLGVYLGLGLGLGLVLELGLAEEYFSTLHYTLVHMLASWWGSAR